MPTIRVASKELTNASQAFVTAGGNIKNLTTSMLNIVQELSSTWSGEAAEAYYTKLRNTETGMNQMYNKIIKSSDNLSQMATIYENAERTNVELANSLKTAEFV